MQVGRCPSLAACATALFATPACDRGCAGGREAETYVPVPSITLPSPDPCGDLDPAACHARALRDGLVHEGPTANPLRARTLHEAACARGHAPACAEAARLFELWGGINGPPDRRPTCEGKDGVACKLSLDYPHALAYHERACELGLPSECTEAGQGYTNAFGYLREDPDRAEALFRRACDAGHGPGCRNLAWRYGERQPERATQLFERACELDDLEGCFDAGLSYELGRGTTRDPAKAVALYRKRCDRAPGYLCTRLADLYVQGAGTPREPAKAAVIYARMCGNYKEDSDSCGKLGALYEKGDGVPRDVAKAIEVYRRGCGVRDQASCRALERLGAR